MANGFEIYQQRKKPETLVTQLKRFRGEYFDKCRLLSKRTAFSWALPYEYEIFISWSLWMTFCGSLHARLSSRYSSLPIQHSSSRRPSIHSSWKYSFRNTVCSHKECRLSSAHVKLLKHNDIRKVNAEKILKKKKRDKGEGERGGWDLKWLRVFFCYDSRSASFLPCHPSHWYYQTGRKNDGKIIKRKRTVDNVKETKTAMKIKKKKAFRTSSYP